jgi:predicted N-acetyltransferase YhbS
MMITIQKYKERDAEEVGQLIAETYSRFNLSFVSPEDRALMLGPFLHARSPNQVHQAAISKTLQSPIFFVAVIDGEIAGVLRGRKERLASLFIRENYHHQGIGRKLVSQFEYEILTHQVSTIRVASSLYTIPFYSKLGYKKSTGMRTIWSFGGYGFPYQPMKKNMIEM